MTEEKTPENQDTSEEQGLILGKYKTQEEADLAFKEMERTLAESKEALDREQRLNALLSTEDDPPPAQEAVETSHYQTLGTVFDEEQAQVVEKILADQRKELTQTVDARINQSLQAERNSRAAAQSFYSDYPELKGFEREVDMEADRMAAEFGDKIKRIPSESLMKEVAKRAKEHLSEQKKKLSKSTLHVESGRTQSPEIEMKKTSTSPKSEDERTADYFKTEVKEFNEKKFKPLRG